MGAAKAAAVVCLLSLSLWGAIVALVLAFIEWGL